MGTIKFANFVFRVDLNVVSKFCSNKENGGSEKGYVRSMHFTFFRSIFSGIKILKGMRSTNHSFNQQHFSGPNSLNIQVKLFFLY